MVPGYCDPSAKIITGTMVATVILWITAELLRRDWQKNVKAIVWSIAESTLIPLAVLIIWAFLTVISFAWAPVGIVFLLTIAITIVRIVDAIKKALKKRSWAIIIALTIVTILAGTVVIQSRQNPCGNREVPEVSERITEAINMLAPDGGQITVYPPSAYPGNRYTIIPKKLWIPPSCIIFKSKTDAAVADRNGITIKKRKLLELLVACNMPDMNVTKPADCNSDMWCVVLARNR